MPSSDSGNEILSRGSDGTLKDTVTHSHVFIFSRSAFRSLQNTLYNKFSDGASLILYDMGEGYGSKLASGLSKKGLDLEGTMREIARLGYLAGWGTEHFKIFDDGRLEIVVTNSMFSVERKGFETSCYFLAGVFGGIWVALKKNQHYFAKEVHCSISGHDTCKFVINERPKK